MTFRDEDLVWASARIPSWKRGVKRIIDIFFSVLLFTFFLPLGVIIAILVKLDSRGPIIFNQERIGYLGKPFVVHKFRTFVHNASLLGDYTTEENDPRITSVGKILRRWSLDEIPQLWNVLKGDMSLVGPRPTLAYQVEKYTEEQKRRLLTKPGMSGLAQVSGRNQIRWPERIQLDIQYINTFSLWQDWVILGKTFGLIFSKRGVYEK